MRSLTTKFYKPGKNAFNYIIAEDNILPNKPLLLVEGFLDYTNTNNFIQKYYKNKISVTTGLVKSISATQIQRIININPSILICMFDNDSWFDYYKLKIKIPFNVDFLILPKGKDPNNLTNEEFKNKFMEIKL